MTEDRVSRNLTSPRSDAEKIRQAGRIRHAGTRDRAGGRKAVNTPAPGPVSAAPTSDDSHDRPRRTSCPGLRGVAKLIWESEDQRGRACPGKPDSYPAGSRSSTPSETEVPADAFKCRSSGKRETPPPLRGEPCRADTIRKRHFLWRLSTAGGCSRRPMRGRLVALETTIRDWWNRPTPVKAYRAEDKGELAEV